MRRLEAAALRARALPGAAWLCALALLAAPAGEAARPQRTRHVVRPGAARPEDNPRLKGDSKAFARARVRFAEPADESQVGVSDDGVRVAVEVFGYALGAPPGAPPDAPRPHAHLIVDNEATLTIEDDRRPVLLKGLRPGPHVLRLVLCRPWHEVVKAPRAFALTRFWLGPRPEGKAGRAAEALAWPNPKKPLLTYVLPLSPEAPDGPRLAPVPEPAPSAPSAPEAPAAPIGELAVAATSIAPVPVAPPAPPAPAARAGLRRKEPRPHVQLDFFLSAARLVRRGYRVRVVIDKKEYPTIRSWKPLRLDRLKPGVHHATIDLLDRRGTKTHTALNRTDRVFLIR
jgi:hypothetical protein